MKNRGYSVAQIFHTIKEFSAIKFSKTNDINKLLYHKINHQQHIIHNQWDRWWSLINSLSLVIIMTNGLIFFITFMMDVMDGL